MASDEYLVDEYYNVTKESREKFGERTIVLCEQGIFFNFLWYCRDCRADKTTDDLFELATAIRSAAVDCLRLQVSVSGTRQPTCKAGFKVSERGKWLRWLFEDGYKVVAMRQSDQRPAGGRGSRLPRRADKRVLTPALHTLDDVDRELDEESSTICGALLTPTQNRLLTDCYDVHVATLSVQAGQLDCTSASELSVEQLADHLDTTFAQTLDLREVVVHLSGASCEKLSDLLRAVCVRHVRSVHVHVIDDLTCYMGARQANQLRAHFSDAKRLGVDLTCAFQLDVRSEAAVAALILLAKFVQMHDPEAMLPLPQAARRSAVVLHNGFMRTLNVMSGQPALIDVFTTPATRMGSRELRSRLLAPLSDIDELNRRLDHVEACARMEPSQRLLLRRKLASVSDTQRLVDRSARATPAQIIRLADDVRVLLGALNVVAQYAPDLSDQVAPPDSAIDGLHEFTALVNTYLERATGGEETTPAQLAQDAFPVDHPLPRARIALADACAALRTAAYVPECAVGEMVHVCYAPASLTLTKHGKQTLAQKTATPFRRWLEAEERSVVPCGKEQRIVSPTIDRLVCNVDATAAHLRQVELDCLVEWRDQTFHVERRRAFDQLLTCLAHVDCAMAIADTAIKHGYVRPQLVRATDGFIEATALRHPIVETLIKQQEPYVPNDVQIGPDAGLLLFGFNSSGKSSLLKSVAIAALMAQAGCFVPASAFTIAPYTDFACRVGNADDLYRAQSSHTREMHEVRTIVHRVAHSRALVVADEPCTSTEARSAERQVAAMLAILVQGRASILVATHMLALTENYLVQGLAGTLRSMHLEAQMRESAVVFLRTLKPGLPPPVEYGAVIAASIVQHQTFRDLLFSRTNASAEDVMARVGMKRRATLVSYNRTLVKGVCLLCGAPPPPGCEHDTHHNQEQHTADATGRVARGGLHDGGNLLGSLCHACHTEIHTGALSSTKWVTTSDGRVVHYSISDPMRSGLLRRRASHAHTANPPWSDTP